MISIAWLTDEKHPEWCLDEQWAVQSLRAKGINPVPVVWDRTPPSELIRYPLAVVRNTWDYYLKFSTFQAWLSECERLGVRLHNPASVVRWNADKRYLSEMTQADLPVVPTLFIERGGQVDLRALLTQACERFGCTEFVLKPVVSASSFETTRFHIREASSIEPRFQKAARDRDFMIQPYADSIQAVGEVSLVFIDGEYSHCLVKRPRSGDFRVQAEFGGSIAPLIPSPSQRDAALAVMEWAKRKFTKPVLYARVDLVLHDFAWRLMELELIEPNLFFQINPGAADRMAEAVRHRLG